MNKNIVVVEDDKNLLEFLRDLLSENGFVVHTATDGLPALELIEKVQPNLVLLDLELPTLRGDSVCLQLKKDYPQLPVIILTARDDSSQIVQGLNLGADDYITKPFNSAELIARINARLRNGQTGKSVLTIGDLTMDTQTIEVTRSGKPISLTPQEFKLLEYLVANKGRVLTRDMILGRLWRTNPDIETRVVDVYIGYLRKKVDQRHSKKLIHSVRGFGYKADDQ